VLHEGMDTNYDVCLILFQSSLHLPSSINKALREKRFKHQIMRQIRRGSRSWYIKYNEINI
jgi:hypothetical protein